MTKSGLLHLFVFNCHPRSVVYQQSSKESATLQPFFTLQLDIQSDKIRTVQDALESLVARESVQGYTTKTKQEVCSTGQEPVWRPSRCMKRTELERREGDSCLLHQLVSFTE